MVKPTPSLPTYLLLLNSDFLLLALTSDLCDLCGENFSFVARTVLDTTVVPCTLPLERGHFRYYFQLLAVSFQRQHMFVTGISMQR